MTTLAVKLYVVNYFLCLCKGSETYCSYRIFSRSAAILCMCFLRSTRFSSTTISLAISFCHYQFPLLWVGTYIYATCGLVQHIVEIWIWLDPAPDTKALTMFSIIKNVLLRCSLLIANCIGRAYLGAANMSSVRNGVQALIKKAADHCPFVHCFPTAWTCVFKMW